jgi:hypothetical protein
MCRFLCILALLGAPFAAQACPVAVARVAVVQSYAAPLALAAPVDSCGGVVGVAAVAPSYGFAAVQTVGVVPSYGFGVSRFGVGFRFGHAFGFNRGFGFGNRVAVAIGGFRGVRVAVGGRRIGARIGGRGVRVRGRR